MLDRAVRQELLKRLRRHPAVALVGPRQSGKTTLGRSLGGLYFDLEQESERLRLDLEWEGCIAGKELLVLDEAQSFPDLFPRLRGAIDRQRKRRGGFLLLGSVSPALMTRVSESLAGRLSQVELTPLLWTELKTKASRERLWLFGGYPDGGVLRVGAYPRWQLDYLALLAQRDLPAWGLAAKPQTTGRMLRMLAASHGQAWNASRIGQSLGLSYHTVNGYLDYLVGAFLIRRLEPYHANIGKRLVRSPKVFWRDTGLLHALLHVPDQGGLVAQSWVGASWEGFVVEQAIGELSSRGCDFDASYFRTSDLHEIDLVLGRGAERWAIEIKLTSSPTPSDMARLDRAADLIGASRRILVSRTPTSTGDETRASCDLAGLIERLRSWPGSGR